MKNKYNIRDVGAGPESAHLQRKTKNQPKRYHSNSPNINNNSYANTSNCYNKRRNRKYR